MIFLLLALQCIFILPTRIQCVIETPKSVFLVGSKVPCVDCCTKEVKSMKVGEPLKNVCHEVISSKGTFFKRRRGGDETFVSPREKTLQHTRLSFNRSLNWVNNRKLACKKFCLTRRTILTKRFSTTSAFLQSCKKSRNVFSFVSCHNFHSFFSSLI